MEITQRYTDEEIADGFRDPEAAKSMLHYVLVDLKAYADGESYLKAKLDADQVNDLLHKAIVSFYEAMVKGKMKPGGSVRGYFFGFLKYTRLAFFREKDAYSDHLEKFGHEQVASAAPPEIEWEETAGFKDIRLANWQRLSEVCRKILKLRQQNLSYAEISEKLDYKNEDTAKAKKNNCKNQLKKLNREAGIA